MLISECIDKIYKRFEKSSEAPDVGSEDFLVRLELCNAAIAKWEHEMGIEWKELFGTLSATLTVGIYADQPALITARFKRPTGSLFIGRDKYQYVRPERVERELELNPSRKIFTVIGSAGNFSIKVYPVIDGAFILNYRKSALQFANGTETEEIEMSDPEFIVYDVCAQLYLEDDINTQASVMSQVASAKMESMKMENETDPFNNNNNLPDDEFKGFGRS